MASIVRTDPFGLRGSWQIRQAPLDRFFDRFFEEATGATRPAAGPTHRGSVAVNLYESEEKYWVDLPVPGVKPEDVEITVRKNVLSVTAKVSWEAPQDAQPIWRGFSSGEWRRTFTLPGDVNADKVSASLEHGILRLELPKADHLRPRTIRVSPNGVQHVEVPQPVALAPHSEPAQPENEVASHIESGDPA